MARREVPPDSVAQSTAARPAVRARLAGDALVYGLGGVANQAVAVLLVPIYARQLGSDGVGVTGVLNSTIALWLMVAGLSLPQAFFRWYLREAEDRQRRSHVLATTLAIRSAASLLAFALALVAAVPLTGVLYDGVHVAVFAVAAPIILFDSLTSIPLSWLRAERRARQYIVISITRTVVGTVLILAFVMLLDVGVIGVAVGAALAAGFAACIALAVLWRSNMLRLSLDIGLARSMLAFGLPLVPAGIAAWVLNLSDRPLLQAMTGSAAVVGVYTLGYTGGLVVNALLVQPFSLAWSAAFWEVSRSDDAPRVFARTLAWYLTVTAGGALALSALGTDALRLLVGPEFELSRFIVPFSAFGFVLYGAYGVVAAGLNIVDRTRLLAYVTGTAAVVSVVLNLALIPFLGMFGAAISTTASYLFLALVSGLVSQRHYPVPWPVGRAIIILALAVGLSAAALLGPDLLPWRLACIAGYLPALLVLRVIGVEELRRLATSLRGGR